MHVDDYAAARRTRLVERAVDLGVDPEAAPALVDEVLAAQRRRIERADDPDPLVHDALERAVRGPSPHRRTTLALGAGALAAVLVGTGAWWVLRPAPQVAVPSSFALDARSAAVAARDLGFRTELRTRPACEPPGLVLSSDPAPGRRVDEGSTVVLTTAVAPDDPCGGLPDREAAWAFLRFARGGPAPAFADTVYVILDGRDPAVLPAAAAQDPRRWAAISDVAAAASLTTPGRPGTPRLVVSSGEPPATTCGVPRPATAGTRPTLRMRLEADGGGCPFTVDLYRSSAGVIDAVVAYSGRS